MRALANLGGVGYTAGVALPLHQLTAEAMDLDPVDRPRLATELIDSVEGSADGDWGPKWQLELQRRSIAADEREVRGLARGDDWSEVKARLLGSLIHR